MTKLTPLTPEQARQLSENGARIVDIRAPDEFARLRIAAAENHPVTSLGQLDGDRPTVFMCRTGMRTGANAERLAQCCDGPAYVLEGGIDGWREAGLPVIEDKGQPLELMRQVQLVAGSLVLVGVLLGFLVAPGWFGLSAFVGAGLVMAGATGWCGMANLLAAMPWNRPAKA